MFHTYEVGFDGTDGVFNILTKTILPQPQPERFLDVQKIGEERYECFVKERIEGDSSIWDTIKKEKLPTFPDNNKMHQCESEWVNVAYKRRMETNEQNLNSIRKPTLN